jgi:hypothetical protein
MARFLAPLLAIFAAGALAAPSEEEVQSFIEVFRSGRDIPETAEQLAWKGISDVRLYDVIEERVLAEAREARRDRGDRVRVARYIRTLGFSGQEKYIPTIESFLGDRAYVRQAQTALRELPQYAKWNPIIADRVAPDPRLDDDTNRILNMLRSDDLLLVRVAAKRVYFKERDPILLEALAAHLRASYARVSQADEVDAVAWMVKALGQTAKESYRPLLEEIRDSQADGKVRRQADSSLRSEPRPR